jgi:outer membrane lipopolysaccharide assembly protein LptE/RlpB
MNKILALLMALILSGCGYTTKGFTFKETEIIIVPVINTIDITSERRINSNYETFPRLIENRLTNELVSKFNIDGHLKVVSQEGPSTLKLTCSVNSYSKEALSYEDDDNVEEQRLRLYVGMKLESPDGKVMISQTVVGEAEYFLSGANQKSESSAQDDLIDDTARGLSEAVLESW